MTSDELKNLIQAKAKLQTPVGTKANKSKAKNQKKPILQLRADMLEVPHAVFKQSDGTELSQITAADIAPGSQGVAIVNIAEAMPYFQLTEPVSPHGVALLVLEFDDPRLPQQHQVMKVPVQSRETQDPLIVKVAVVQIGQQSVLRNVPAHTIAVPEVPNPSDSRSNFQRPIHWTMDGVCTQSCQVPHAARTIPTLATV